MSLLFSTAMPIVTVFAALFFFFRYYIEKYNLVFVYQQDYESRGNLRVSLIWFQIIGVILFQLMNFAFQRTLGSNTAYLIAGYCFVLL
jgi:hypothetical protein